MLKQPTSFFGNVRGDFMGGLTAGIVALPLALAFGSQTELGAIGGLYGAIAIAIIAALFGGTPTQISGPTAPMTVVTGLIIVDSINFTGSLEASFPLIIATFMVAGLMQIIFGVMKLGTYIKYIPYPVVSGFMSGIGVIIIITQIFPFLGVYTPIGGALGTIITLHKIPEVANIWSISIALLTIAVIYLSPKLLKKVPGTLVALVLLTSIVYFFLPIDYVYKINSDGPIPGGLPKIYTSFISVFVEFKHFDVILKYAFTLAALGSIDSLLTSVVADNLTKDKHDSNKELIGQGLGNIGSALIGGLPGAGATMRTVINISSGGTGRLSGVIAGLFLLAVLLGLGKIVGHIPNPVLAGILITVGISIIDYKGIRHVRHVPPADAIVMILVLLLTVLVDLLVAVGIGLILSLVLFMKKMADIVENKARTSTLQQYSLEMPWPDELDYLEKWDGKVFVKHLEGPIFFGFAGKFQDMLKNIPDMRLVVIRMDYVPYIDQTGLYALEEAILFLKSRKIDVLLVNIQVQPAQMFKKLKIIPMLIPAEHCFTTFKECIQYVYDLLHREHKEMSPPRD